MSTTHSICAPGQGRTARWCTLVAAWLTFLMMVLLPPLLVRAGVADGIWCFVAFAAHLTGALVYLLATTPWRPEMQGRLLTARTLFGRRTVDLDRLTRVRHLSFPSQAGPATDWLLLTDAHGVQLAVQEPGLSVFDPAEQAIAQAALSPSGGVRVSRGARERLQPEDGRPESCLGMVLKVLFWTLLVLVVGTATSMALLLVSLSLAGAL